MTEETREQTRGISETSARASPTSPRLRGPWLLVVRVAWVAAAITALTIVIFSIPASFEQYRTVCTVASEVCSERAVQQPTPEGVRDLHEVGLSLDSYAALSVAAGTFFRAVWLALGALIFWKRSDDRMALLVSLFLVSFGTATFNSEAIEVLVSTHWAWWLPARGLQVLGEVCAVLFFFLFPGGRFVPRWTRWIGVAFLAFQIPNDLFPELYLQYPALDAVQPWVFLGFLASMVWSQVYRYRRISAPEQRLQTRWVVFGVSLAIGLLISIVLPFATVMPWPGGNEPILYLLLSTGLALAMLLIPLSIGVAVLRSRLFDIDVVINRTLVYGSLTIMLVVLYFGGIVLLQRVFVAFTGQQSTLAIVASTLAIAALFNPLRRSVQEFVDLRFYRRKYDAAKTLATFNSRLREETDLDSLSDEVLGVVRETMQPEHASLWLHPHGTDAKEDVPS